MQTKNEHNFDVFREFYAALSISIDLGYLVEVRH